MPDREKRETQFYYDWAKETCHILELYRQTFGEKKKKKKRVTTDTDFDYLLVSSYKLKFI